MRILNTYYENFESLKKFILDNSEYFFENSQSAILVQIFSGCCEQVHFSRVSSEVYKLIPHACIVGATTGGGIMDGDISDLKTVISFSIFYGSKVQGILFEKGDQSDFNLGSSITSAICSEASKALILFSTSMTINANQLLLGIQRVNPSLPVVGGNAGDICHMRPAMLSYNGKITSSGIVGVAIEGDKLTVSRYWHLGWQPIGKAMTVTQALGKRIYTIDHVPAYEIYRKYLGLDKTEIFSNAVEYPLMANRCGVQVAGVPVILYDDDSIEFGVELLEKETVRLSFGNVDMILESIQNLCEAINDQCVEGIFIYSCSCRKSFLQDSIRLEIEPLQEIAPTAGFFTSGEFFHTEDMNHLLNATMTVLALSEKDCSSIKGVHGMKKVDVTHRDDKDYVVNKNIGVLKALTYLINSVISELEQAQAKLQYNVIGEMAAGIGHEVRNPMTTVRGYLQMFQRDENFLEYRGQISTMIEELDRANAIITEFLSLSKYKRLEMKCGNMNSVLNALFPLLQADAFQRGHEIKLETSVIPDSEFDSNEIKQLVINLVRNGLEAMKSAGILIIRTRFYDNEILLSIQDTGSGIPSEIMSRLGTPFVTTKIEGTGLGLSVCYRIADRHGARIDIKTGPTGTMFTVKFKVSIDAQKKSCIV